MEPVRSAQAMLKLGRCVRGAAFGEVSGTASTTAGSPRQARSLRKRKHHQTVGFETSVAVLLMILLGNRGSAELEECGLARVLRSSFAKDRVTAILGGQGVSGERITLGTDCSGSESPVLALRRLGVQFVHKFACEIDPAARACIRANCSPHRLYKDTRSKRRQRAGHTDVYVAGFPCQPFSRQGQQAGFADRRGDIFEYILAHLRRRRPKVFVLENVLGLRHMHEVFAYILAALEALSVYNVYTGDLNPENFGIPQHRPRYFIVGILRSCDNGTFEFPVPCRRCSLDQFSPPREDRPRPTDLPTTQIARANALATYTEFRSRDWEPLDEC